MMGITETTTPTDAGAAVAVNGTPGGPTLPGGLLVDGERFRRCQVRELNGADEERLTGRAYAGAAEQVTDFLVHVIERIEGYKGAIDHNLVGSMLVGDRDYLLLWLRQTTVGDRVNQVMRCPNPDCARKVDVEFSISELPVHQAQNLKTTYDFELSRPALADDPSSNRGAFRLPTGKDQDDLAAFAAEGEGRANTRLFSRILVRLGRRAKVFEEEARAFPWAVRQELADKVRQVSPGPDLKIDVPCPYCAADMAYPFDLRVFFLGSWQ